jgi:hypothetical protein
MPTGGTGDPEPMPKKPMRDGLAKGFSYHMGDRKRKFKGISQFRCAELAMIAHLLVGALPRCDPPGSTFNTWQDQG